MIGHFRAPSITTARLAAASYDKLDAGLAADFQQVTQSWLCDRCQLSGGSGARGGLRGATWPRDRWTKAALGEPVASVDSNRSLFVQTAESGDELCAAVRAGRARNAIWRRRRRSATHSLYQLGKTANLNFWPRVFPCSCSKGFQAARVGAGQAERLFEKNASRSRKANQQLGSLTCSFCWPKVKPETEARLGATLLTAR